ncbi:MAG: hypothetical protein U0136_16540 [Bdellovibrionota bacterium]
MSTQTQRFKRKTQSQPLRIEDPRYASFITSRCLNSALWFVNNKPLDNHMLGYLGKYREKHNVTLYAFVMQGNHYHTVAKFPDCNRAGFERDFNSQFAAAVKRFVPGFPGGPLFQRRYSAEAVPNPEDIEDSFFYSALQPVCAGLLEEQDDYPSYNSFYDAIWGRERTVKVFRASEYNSRRRYNAKLKKEDFTDEFTLKYARLPGYEDLSQTEYAKLMLKKREEHRVRLVDKFKAENHTFLTKQQVRATVPGTLPRSTKKSTLDTSRPLIRSKNPATIRAYLSEHFPVHESYKRASERYLLGEDNVVFPPGTYRPPARFTPYPRTKSPTSG